MSSTVAYKWCFVPQCTNSTSLTPNKIFLPVPRAVEARRKWAQMARRDDKDSLVSSAPWFCCEDHFELEDDTANFTRFKLMAGRLLLKKGKVPHKFECQGRHKERARLTAAKRDHRRPSSEALSATVHLDEAATMHISDTMTDSLPLIMECSVEELSEVQTSVLKAAKQAYEDAVRKANRLLDSLPPAEAPPSSPPIETIDDDDDPRPAAAPSPPPPRPAPTLTLAPLPRSSTPLIDNSAFNAANLTSEIPPPQRISLPTSLPANSRKVPMVSQPAAAFPATPAAEGPSPAPASAPAPDAPTSTEKPAPVQSDKDTGEGKSSVASSQQQEAGGSADNSDSSVPTADDADMQVRAFPALHVIVRTPNAFTISKGSYAARRAQLDARVKKLLQNTPSQFTEWLIQMRLVRAVQFCPIHPVTWSGQPRQLRLGMFTDSDKLAQSGGYVWVKTCCRPKFLSVHHGSLFDSNKLQLPSMPAVVLKLMYHWSCQTPLHNVTHWLKLRPHFVDRVFGLFRAVCMLKTEEPASKLGCAGSTVQVGLVSLGTSGLDGLNKNVKVEVLGVKDETTGEIRLVGFEPRIKNRIRAVVGAVQDWVHHESNLLLDHSISPLPFRNCFRNVENAPAANKDTAGNIMHYLRRNMPRMFQSSLVYLKPLTICQFIAEITWREKYGRDPNSTFSNLIAHLSVVTQQCEGSLADMLKKVLLSPSMDLQRQPRKQTLATRPDSQPEFASHASAGQPAGAASAVAAGQLAPGEQPEAAGTEPTSESADWSNDVAESSPVPSEPRGTKRRARGASRPSGREKAERISLVDCRNYAFFKLASLQMVKLPDLSELRCWECKLPLTHPGHLTGVYACKRCRYTTSCEKIYPVHRRVFHSPGVAPVFSMGSPIHLDQPLYCRCGYSTTSGNRLAAHMMACECKTALATPAKIEETAHLDTSGTDSTADLPISADVGSTEEQIKIECLE